LFKHLISSHSFDEKKKQVIFMYIKSCLHYGFGDFSSPHITLRTGPYPGTTHWNLIFFPYLLMFKFLFVFP
ncbi:hypothetical protein L9F63_006176, partial [Diploptera punctata]